MNVVQRCYIQWIELVHPTMNQNGDTLARCSVQLLHSNPNSVQVKRICAPLVRIIEPRLWSRLVVHIGQRLVWSKIGLEKAFRRPKWNTELNITVKYFISLASCLILMSYLTFVANRHIEISRLQVWFTWTVEGPRWTIAINVGHYIKCPIFILSVPCSTSRMFMGSMHLMWHV